MRTVLLIVIAVAAALAVACGTSREDYQRIVDEARACSPGDRCALAGGGQCTCATPVNERDVARVDEAAQDVACGGAMVECASHENVRCDDGRCTSN